MPVLGIISCEALELEMAYVIGTDPDIVSVTIIESEYSADLLRILSPRDKPVRSIVSVNDFVAQKADKFEVLIKIMRVGLHSVIENLKNRVEDALHEIAPYCDGILLGYGLCGNALKNIDAIGGDITIPIHLPMDDDHPVDDCVALCIGGRENYYEEQCRVAGTMFINSGFARHWKDIFYKSSKANKFGLDGIKRLMANYERSLLLPSPVATEEDLADLIQEFNQLFGLRIESRPGSLDLLFQAFLDAKQKTQAHFNMPLKI